MTILTFTGHYIPGCKAGGPIRSLANLVECLGDEFEFRIITSDRDGGDTEPYPGIPRNQWVSVGRAQVMYLSPGRRRLSALARLIRATPHDVLYLNSFFSDAFTIRPLLLRRLGLAPRAPTIVAPRGEFGCGALSVKARKKRAYRAVAKVLGLCSGVTWQASSAAEEGEIRRIMGPRVPIAVGPDVFVVPTGDSQSAAPRVSQGAVRLVTVSRISPVKNLHWLSQALQGVQGEVSLDLYGRVSDPDYWALCQRAFEGLPDNVTITYRGPVDHSDVPGILARYDLFVLPTLGENFGHAIAEALAVGCPVLISDQTPWHGLSEAKAGWDLPLDNPAAFAESVQRIIDMPDAEHAEWRRGAREYIAHHSLVTQAVEANRELFALAVRSG